MILINPPPEKIIEEYDAPSYGHLGLAYLASALKGKKIDCAVLDSKLARLKPDDLLGRVYELKPKIVGITSHTHEIMNASALAHEIKRRLPNTRITIGGVHASSLPAQTMKDFDCYDFLVKGEGERAFPALCEAILDGREEVISTIKGVFYRKDGRIEAAPPGEWIDDLDSLSFPAWSLFTNMKVFSAITSRGCPYGCIFCARMLGDRVRTRSPENVIAELKMLVENFNARWIYFYDETFGFYKAWLEKFLNLMISTSLAERLRWGIMTRAQLLDEEMVRRLKEAGCRKIDFGVESGDERILRLINKGERKEDFIRAAALIKKAGIESHSYYILGHPTETKKTAMNTIDFAAQLNTDRISIGIMIPYPGTKVASLAEKGEGGYKRVSLNWSDYNKQLGDALELESLSKRDLTRLQLLGYIKFYIRNFKVIPFILAFFKYYKLIFAMVTKYINKRKNDA